MAAALVSWQEECAKNDVKCIDNFSGESCEKELWPAPRFVRPLSEWAKCTRPNQAEYGLDLRFIQFRGSSTVTRYIINAVLHIQRAESPTATDVMQIEHFLAAFPGPCTCGDFEHRRPALVV